MKITSRSIVLYLAIMVQLAACSGGGGGGGNGNTVDTTPPTVIFNSPANAAAGVSINSAPSVTFSEPMNASTVHQSTFTLKDNSGYPVSGTVESTSQTAIFHPSVALAYSTTYIATIMTGVRDVAGNALSNELTWTFTTEPWPAPAPPTGLTAVPREGKVTLSWDLASDLTTSYCLYWSTNPGVTKNNGNKIALGQLVSSYLHENLTGGTTYYYVITETLNGSEGAESVEVSATPPFSTSITRFASDGSFAWQRGVNGNVSGVAMAALPDGSFYVTGNFSCTVIFGTGEANQTTLTQQPSCSTSAGAPIEMFVARYYADGSLAWARQTQNSVVREPKGLTVLSDGSLVVVGSFTGDMTLAPTTLAGTSWSDVFIARYAGNGSLLWAKSAVVNGYLAAGDEARAVVTLSDDSVVLTGSFFESITFSPGDPGSVTLNTEASCNTNDFDIFVARYTKDGAVLWARRAGGCAWDEGLSIAMLQGDKTAITGRFQGTATFNPGEAILTKLTSSSTSVQSYDMFVASFDSTGNLLWARSAQSQDVDDVGSGICTTATNSLVVTGSLGGTTTFGAGELHQTVLNGSTAYVAQYNATDGTLGWAAGIGGDFVPSAVAPAPLGAATIAGTLFTTATLGGTVMTTPYTDILLTRYTAAGSPAWVKRVDRGPTTGRYVSVLSDGSILVLGTKVSP